MSYIPAAAAGMDETTVKKPNGITSVEGNSDDVSADDEECDVEVWDRLSRSFRQAQTVLDQNHALIQQVNKNHQSKIPDNLVKNVALIREINGNILKVLSIYSDLSINFSNIVHQRRLGIVALKNDEGKGDSVEHVVDKSQMIEACGTAFYVIYPQI